MSKPRKLLNLEVLTIKGPFFEVIYFVNSFLKLLPKMEYGIFLSHLLQSFIDFKVQTRSKVNIAM